MTCEHFILPGGGSAIICSDRRHRKRCRCGRVADLLCDAPAGKGTCDAPICSRCAVHVGENRDLCPAHQRQGELAL